MTTDNLPAVVQDRAPVAVQVNDVDSWIPVISSVVKLAEHVAGTDFVPRGLRDSAPAVAAAILYGREVGLPPMTALNVTHVIEGKPAISAEGMRAMVFAAGHEIVIVQSDGALCTVKGRRRGSQEWTSIAWSLDMARAAGVAGKKVWQSYPRQMLQARATAELCRLIFPDVTHGFRAVEEVDDGYEDGPGDAPAGPTTKVARGRAAKKAAAVPPQGNAAPLEERPERPAQAGPPLPGEDGYESSEGGAPGPLPGAGSEPSEPPSGQTTGVDEAPEEEGPAGADGGEAIEPAGPEVEGGEAGGATPPRPRAMTRPQQRGIEAMLTDLGVDNDRDERHLIAGTILRRAVTSFTELDFDDARVLIETLGRIKTKEELTALLDAFDQEPES